MAEGGATITLIGIPSSMPSSSIIGRSVGSLTTMTRAPPSRPNGTNPYRSISSAGIVRNKSWSMLKCARSRNGSRYRSARRRACAISAAFSAADCSAVPVSTYNSP